MCYWVIEQRASNGDQADSCVVMVQFPTCCVTSDRHGLMLSLVKWNNIMAPLNIGLTAG